MKKLILSALFISLSLFYVNAQSNNDSINVSLSVINTRNSELDIVEDFRTTISHHFNDPKMPRFLLYDQKSDMAFGIGGFVRIRTAYDFAGSPTNSFGFIPNSIPVPSDPLTKNDFRMDISKSSLFFKLLGNNSTFGRYQLYLSADFTGNNNAFTINDAYVSLLGFTVGRTWSTFNDMAAVPPTVDFQGPNGAAEMRTPQIRYTYNFNNGLSFALAAELPNTRGTYQSLQTAETTQRIPDLPAYLQYNWGKGDLSHIRIAGVLRNMNYRNLIKDKTETATGYGVQMSSKVGICQLIDIYGQATYGKGVAQYINDLSRNGLDLIEDSDQVGKMTPQEVLGWFGQMRFNLSKSLFTSVGYSQAKVFPKSDVVSGKKYRYGQYVVGNVFYNLTSDLQLGAEYLWGNRVNINGDKASANCIQAVMQFNF